MRSSGPVARVGSQADRATDGKLQEISRERGRDADAGISRSAKVKEA